jgi:hypothetical protein
MPIRLLFLMLLVFNPDAVPEAAVCVRAISASAISARRGLAVAPPFGHQGLGAVVISRRPSEISVHSEFFLSFMLLHALPRRPLESQTTNGIPTKRH